MGSKSVTSSSYDGRYYRFTVSQVGTTTKVNWTFEVLGGDDLYYTASPINLYINGHNVYSKGRTGWSTKVFPAAKGSTNGSYDIGSYGNFTITLSGRPYYESATSSSGTVTLDRPKYDVIFMPNGGSGEPSKQVKTFGINLTLSSVQPTRYGYEFLGWGISSVDTTVDYLPGATYTDDSVTVRHLYAIWKKDIGLHYDDNGGNGSPSGSTATIYNATTGYTFTISTTKPTRTGYDFLGWSLDNKATTASYQPGSSITLTNTSVLYAVWKLKTYQISYNANGGTGAPSAQTKTYGVNLKLSTVEPTRSGYKFLGWSTSNTAEEPTYLSGGTFTTNANTTLYAVWEQLGIAYINIDGTYQAGKIWVNDNGTWMSGIIFVNDNGTWTQGGI